MSMKQFILAIAVLLIAPANAQMGTMGAGSSGPARPIVVGDNWPDVLERLPCDHAKREGGGAWSIAGLVEVAKERFQDRKVTDVAEVAVLERHCPHKPGCNGTRMSLTGAGC